MTELLYTIDSYIQKFEVTVLAHVTDERLGQGVVLDRTAFYPGGGGQPCDFGTLTTQADAGLFAVSAVKRVGGKVVHFIEGVLPPVGAAMIGQLDWERRYKLMRTHSAMHVLCGVVFRDYAAQVTGGNMQPLEARMDFEFETMRKELVAEIELAVNVEVTAARDVRVNILPREEAFAIPDLIRTKINLLPKGISEIRTIELVGLDLQADGGTHVANTSEIGRIRIPKYKSKGRINKRLYVELAV